jgi:tRNA 2-thiouridine synthesizing protein B
VLLIEDAVYAVTRGSPASERLKAAMPGVHFYVLEPDLEARAMAGACVEGVERVDYRGFVDLVAKHARVQSWL